LRRTSGATQVAADEIIHLAQPFRGKGWLSVRVRRERSDQHMVQLQFVSEASAQGAVAQPSLNLFVASALPLPYTICPR
jgi:hypothetical protein